MDNKSLKDKIILEQNRLNTALCSHKEYIWKNILKIEAIKKQDSLRKSQALCQSLQIK